MSSLRTPSRLAARTRVSPTRPRISSPCSSPRCRTSQLLQQPEDRPYDEYPHKAARVVVVGRYVCGVQGFRVLPRDSAHDVLERLSSAFAAAVNTILSRCFPDPDLFRSGWLSGLCVERVQLPRNEDALRHQPAQFIPHVA